MPILNKLYAALFVGVLSTSSAIAGMNGMSGMNEMSAQQKHWWNPFKQ